MPELVADASSMVDALLITDSPAKALLRNHTVHAPTLIDYEFAQVMRKASRAASVGADRAETALLAFNEMTIERHDARRLLPRIWSLREHFTAYDASYVALAESLGIALLTKDSRLAHAAQHVCEIITA